MSLLLEYFTSEIDELDEKNVCIRILGDKDGLPAPQRDALIAAETRTARNTGLKLNIAINYGGRAEIVRAARMLAQKAVSGEITPEDIDENAFAAALYTHDLPDVDLLIRTSGEMRLSNFLLYQCAYAEMEFPTVLWPDFSLADYHAALEAFAARDRRFGGRKQ
ncbi:MAG: polyprenyl diphosphate synthase [Christensenellales bacterium]